MSSLTIEQMAADLERWRKTQKKGYPHYPDNLKEKVLSFQKNHSLPELSRRLNIPSTTLANWVSRAPHQKLLQIETPTQSFVELPPMAIPAHRIILKLPSGIEFTFEGEVKTEYLADLALALSRRELP